MHTDQIIRKVKHFEQVCQMPYHCHAMYDRKTLEGDLRQSCVDTQRFEEGRNAGKRIIPNPFDTKKARETPSPIMKELEH